jgi:hypothetical protein
MALIRYSEIPILRPGIIVCFDIHKTLTPCVLGTISPITGRQLRIVGVEGVYDTFDIYSSYSIEIGIIPNHMRSKIIEYDDIAGQNIESRWKKIHKK